jgi:transcription-repair coupling factor (superfamily II helicase)
MNKNIDFINHLPKKSATKIFSSIVDSSYGLVLSQIRSSAKGNILFVARDDLRMNMIKEDLNFFDKTIEIIDFPSWDLLPYDRTSPNAYVSSNRTKSLAKMLNNKKDKLIITSAAALIQKVPPKNIMTNASLELAVNDKIARASLVELLLKNGFNRSVNANETGEFACRGSIIDIVTNDNEYGYRLDFFGDLIESIKLFDPLTQASTTQIDKITIFPASEIILNDESRELFSQNFRRSFGIKACDDPLYRAIIEGRKYPGMENWLPLFYDGLDTIFDYQEFDLVIFDYLTKQSILERNKTIQDHYQARLENLNSKSSDAKYYPVEPNTLWIDNLGDILAKNALLEFSNFSQESENALNFPIKSTPNFSIVASQNNENTLELLKNYKVQHPKLKIMIACFSNGSLERMRNLLDQHQIHGIVIDEFIDHQKIKGKAIGLTILAIESGFIYDDLMIISEQDLLGVKAVIRKPRKKTAANFIKDASNLTEGELVVHNDHGIGKFAGLETITVFNIDHDCLSLIYLGGDKLYIPVENIEVLTRYGSDEGTLDKLGGASWNVRKEKLKERIKLAAEGLIKIAAERELKNAPQISYATNLYDEFCARFEYFETDDQLNAIEDVKKDLSNNKPMDRLICGDVGFGKTEIALRAAFMSIFSEDHSAKNQVAVIVPTTLLARQHYKSFTKRFAGFNVNIRLLSRMVTSKEAKLTKEGLQNGEVDIVIGTHALLAKNISFANLVLLIIDEEQNFGVGQKERIKELKANLHILTLTATPLPRTLQMSLAGIKELSLIATPPVDRLAVKTSIMEFDPVIIREAILREHYRGGKCFYICAHISELEKSLVKLNKLVPEIKIVMAHGQMPPNTLDQIMNDFYDGKYDLLLSTTIVESGLDIADANTIFIDNADRFGLAQLYQLRGRVGRGKIRAYAYLLTKPDKLLSKTAIKRLEVMQTLDTLGAGFTVASHDMDIRGFGNLVGEEQSGHIKEVGVELYQKMLQEAVENLVATRENQEIKLEQSYAVQINIGLSVLIPKDYIEELPLRMALYQRIANFTTDEEIENIKIEMIDRFGSLPNEVKNLLAVIELKQLCKKLNINKLDAGPKAVVVGFHNNKLINQDKLLPHIMSQANKYKIRPDQKLVINIATEDAGKRFNMIKKHIMELCQLVI